MNLLQITWIDNFKHKSSKVEVAPAAKPITATPITATPITATPIIATPIVKLDDEGKQAAVFRHFDADGDGYWNLMEFKALLKFVVEKCGGHSGEQCEGLVKGLAGASDSDQAEFFENMCKNTAKGVSPDEVTWFDGDGGLPFNTLFAIISGKQVSLP